MRSVTKITKEKTAKIIPNAVGVCTEEDKHIFASLLSRDTTFKLMTRLWKRTIRVEAGEATAIIGDTRGILEEADLMLPDDTCIDGVNPGDMINDELSTDSEGDGPTGHVHASHHGEFSSKYMSISTNLVNFVYVWSILNEQVYF